MALSRRQGLGEFALYVKPIAGARARVKIRVRPWATVADLKEEVCAKVLGDGTPPARTRLFCRGLELVDAKSLAEAKVRRRDLVYVDTVSEEDLRGDAMLLSLHLSDTLLGLEPPPELVACFDAARGGITAGHAPVLAADGTGGTYFFPDAEKRFVAAFKPGDEEPFCVNNPRGYARRDGSDESMRAGIRPGEAHYREVAAYFMDRGGFTGVPAATLAEARHTAFSNLSGREATQRKQGSLQAFVPHDAVVEDGDQRFLPVSEVHRIAMFDMRLLNGDRNNENILVVRNVRPPIRERSVSDAGVCAGSPASLAGSFESLDLARSCPSPSSLPSRESSTGWSQQADAPKVWDVNLVPIDHGFCLPERLEIGWCDWTWLEWPQLKQPLSSEDRAYLLELDPYEEAARLEKVLPIRESALRNMVAAGILLREGVLAGLTLYDIANIIARQDLDTPSELENIILLAEKHAKRAFRRQGRYGSRPFQPRTFAFGNPDNARVTDDVEQVCCGLASPNGRKGRNNRRSVGTLADLAGGTRVVTPKWHRRHKLTPRPGMKLSRVASYGGFHSLGMDDDSNAYSPSPQPPSDALPPAAIRGSASEHHLSQEPEDRPTSPEPMLEVEATPTPARESLPAPELEPTPMLDPTPGGPLMRTRAVTTSPDDVGRAGAPLTKLLSEALPPRLNLPLAPIAPGSALKVPSPVMEDCDSPMNESSEDKGFDHFFFGAVELHLRPLVERKRRLRDEATAEDQDDSLDEGESGGEAEGVKELQSQLSGEERGLPSMTSFVGSVSHSQVWGV